MLIISIDLWGTLIKSSPFFIKSKVVLTQKYFDATENHILESFSQTKKQLNSIIENTGYQPTKEIIFNLLFSKLNGCYANFNFFNEYYFEYQKLANLILPQIYSTITIDVLKELTKIGVLYLSSNTMMINGNSLETIINTLGFGYLFNKMYFSDKVGVSKPNSLMYGNSNYHIGDNILTDEIGALCANSTPIIINSNDKTIKDAFDFIIQRR